VAPAIKLNGFLTSIDSTTLSDSQLALLFGPAIENLYQVAINNEMSVSDSAYLKSTFASVALYVPNRFASCIQSAVDIMLVETALAHRFNISATSVFGLTVCGYIREISILL
jgi:hypothetical protein